MLKRKLEGGRGWRGGERAPLGTGPQVRRMWCFMELRGSVSTEWGAGMESSEDGAQVVMASWSANDTTCCVLTRTKQTR